MQMKFNQLQITEQLNEVLRYYPLLKEEKNTSNGSILLIGTITVARSYNGYAIDNNYNVKIVIPLHNYELPYVIDTGMNIDLEYPHIYPDRKLCLETDAYVAFAFSNGYTLLNWMIDVVEPYYFSYEYYKRYGEYPFGERDHNIIGVYQAYQQIFKVSDNLVVFKLLRSISTQKYRGHLLCPCSSGKITRKCHGDILLKFYNDNQLFNIANTDYNNIIEVLRKYDK